MPSLPCAMPCRRRASYVLWAVLVLLGAHPRAEAQGNDFLRSNPKFVEAFQDVVRPHRVTTVRIQCDGKDSSLGMVVGTGGWVLTKAHDLRGKITCTVEDGQTFDASLVGVHEPHDLAMLKVPTTFARSVTFADSKSARPGSWVASVGMAKVPAAIGVVSVATRKASEGYLGIQVDATPQGLVVQGILEKSAAWKAGLQSMDVVLSVNGTEIMDIDQLQQTLGEFSPGDAVVLRIRRDNRVREVKAILQSRETVRDFRAEFQNRMGSELSTRRDGYSIFLQHDSVVRPADCGGPLVDLKGRVIGMNISRSGRVETLAIPGEVIGPLLPDLQSGRWAPKKERAAGSP